MQLNASFHLKGEVLVSSYDIQSSLDIRYGDTESPFQIAGSAIEKHGTT